MTLTELIALQREFDSKHQSNFKWDAEITNENVHLLGNLVLSLAGETGELANLVKKTLRGDSTLDENKEKISEEVADVFIYLIKIAYQANIDIEAEFLKKLDKNRSRFSRFTTPEEL